ncbi:hypothetical protein LXL04_023817 [Taraxacum kok-saghyz]
MPYLFEIQVKINLSSCNVIEAVHTEIECVMEIKGRGTPDLKEDEASYIWALSAFKKTLENREPSVIMTDRELALMNAIKKVFPNMTNLLCIWHIEKNVLPHCKKYFDAEEFDNFMASTMTDCTGHVMATMGLPCAHKINHLYRKPLSLYLIHPHWKIDTLRLDSKGDSQNDVVNEFDGLLSELSTKYQTWPLSKKEIAISIITKLLNESDTFFEPMILRPKGRHLKAKKKRGVNSTA